MLGLIWGGSASGKSEMAERAALSLRGQTPILYVAAMIGRGEDARARIERHRARRDPALFQTLERPFDLEHLALPPGAGCALLECLGTLLANERYERGLSHAQAARATLRGVLHLAAQTRHLLVVGNDVFRDGVRYDGETAEYVGALGALTRSIAEQADFVVEAVCGLPVIQTGGELWRACEG